MAASVTLEQVQLGSHWPFAWCHRWVRRPWAGATLAIALVVIGLAVRLAMGADAPAPLLPFYPAFVIAAFVGGRMPGYLAAVLSWILAFYLFLDPAQGWHLGRASAIAFAVFVPTSVIVLEVVHRLCRSAVALMALARRLEREARWQDGQRTELLGVIDELQAIYDQAPVGLGLLDADLKFTRINRALAEMNGFTAEEHLGRKVFDLLPDLRQSAEPVLRKVLDAGEVIRGVEISGETPARPGVKRTWSEVFYPVHSGDGERRGVGIFCVEITDLKQAQEREHLLTREVDHRAKNLLSVVQSIVRMTKPAGGVEEYRNSLQGRIAAINRAHSHLARHRWDGVPLGILVAEELEAYGIVMDMASDVRALVLNPAAAQALGMVLHELATNSAKYGALSTDGEVTFIGRWEKSSNDAEPMLACRWKERGGPAVAPPTRQGFGTRLIEGSVRQSLRGKVEYRFLPEGVECDMMLPRAIFLGSPAVAQN
ncbi:sensor histidine kinase [Novosphingobium cyanobacteriorum]|uniref:histidine kinase n=1 Tax=Novosphingobium cyanobacteriorum TaxID=3024215 RepID=A0ABT6CIN0_9SPHN|nr:PAS domain-containing protein [Novosphingobium cyanobacteriorum]MDF8333775.1 PAS domain-containing protein [Novosphingobium cyanobacteriorum]